MRNALPMALAIVALICIVTFAMYVRAEVWQECRATHTFNYCWIMMNR